MKIDILCGSGSPDGVSLQDLHGTNGRVGVGGAEYALLTLCEGWAKAGHSVTLYNNARTQNEFFEHRRVNEFDKTQDRDVFIVFREPTPKITEAKGLKVFWSCDQYTAGDFAHFSKFVDRVVVISPYHAEYFKNTYAIENAISIDLPVRTQEYVEVVDKVPNRLVFTSVPDRGLEIVKQTFPAVRDAIPDASLVITSDYRLWGVDTARNQHYIQAFKDERNVRFLGAATRERLVLEQLQAQIHFYPCTYPELFCIAAAESQVAGVLPITSTAGALATTNMGVLVGGSPTDSEFQKEFVETTIMYLQSPGLSQAQLQLRSRALERFNLDRILNEWNEKVFRAG